MSEGESEELQVKSRTATNPAPPRSWPCWTTPGELFVVALSEHMAH